MFSGEIFAFHKYKVRIFKIGMTICPCYTRIRIAYFVLFFSQYVKTIETNELILTSLYK